MPFGAPPPRKSGGSGSRGWVQKMKTLYNDPFQWQLVKSWLFFGAGIIIAREIAAIDLSPNPLATVPLLRCDRAVRFWRAVAVAEAIPAEDTAEDVALALAVDTAADRTLTAADVAEEGEGDPTAERNEVFVISKIQRLKIYF
ncbi:unnamed protein product [Medioppia subpectinata]|uniref:Uncharacterized protein n=1 Tax=Medioppia subpectinata TaxID=1979941 RepID=A0A7R9QG10_9ACAR|nr:unnamed protein product [Medioppia subpectinata]CAG2119383.1 unnamed protein product [Medioppia subpectinata]